MKGLIVSSEEIKILESLLEKNTQQEYRKNFEEEMQATDAAVVQIGQTICSQILPMTEAFLEGDVHRAKEIIALDAQIKVDCKALQEAIIRLLALQAPVARDLRRIVATLHIISSLERSWVLLRHVGESLSWVHPPSLSPKLRNGVKQIAEVTAKVYQDGVNAWDNRDALAANEIDISDDQVDLLQKVLLTELYTGSQGVEESVSIALIARYFERIADHGVQLSRQVAYLVTGEHAEAKSYDNIASEDNK